MADQVRPMPVILFRADAMPGIGTGDLVSFTTLARHFEARGWECRYLVRDTEAARSILAARGIVLVDWLNAGAGMDEEVSFINRRVSELVADALFIQITRVPLEPYSAVRPGVLRCGVVFQQGFPRDWDMAVSWDVEADRFFAADGYEGMRLFLGPEYTPFPHEFDQKRIAARYWPEATRNVLVAMGGADEEDLTRAVAERLAEVSPGLRVRLVVGGGYRHLDSLRATVAGRPLECEIKQNLPSLFEEYLGCDLAIGAGGLTSAELVATRTPALLVAAVEHQVARCRYFDDRGLARFLGTAKAWNLQMRDLDFRPRGAGFAMRVGEVVDWIDAQARRRRGM